jgi:hypothetical protein
MHSNIQNLAVEIVRFVAGGFPGWVACEFVDAEGNGHTLIDKYPGFSSEVLDADSSYPQSGTARCEVLARWQDAWGRELVRITIARPDVIESTAGLTEFVVLSTQLSSGNPAIGPPS